MNNQLIRVVSTKVCSKCQDEKPLREFWKDKSSKDGLQDWCKSCFREIKKENKERLLQEHKKFQEENQIKEKKCSCCKKIKSISEFCSVKASKDGFNYRCKDCCNKTDKQDRLKNPEKFRERGRLNHLKNREKDNLRRENPEKSRIRHKKYNAEHPEETKERNRTYQRKRRQKDIDYRILCNCRNRINYGIRTNQKSGHTAELLMCSIPEVKAHLEKHWLTGMTWENWGYGNNKWHIDHIIPCAFFNMLDPVEQYMCFRWQNLQPMWQIDNFKKNDKIIISM